MDNLPAHKVQGVSNAIAKVGAKVVYLSPYSPDFNQARKSRSLNSNHIFARLEARTREALHDAIRDGLQLITLKDYREQLSHDLWVFYSPYDSPTSPLRFSL